MLLFFPGIGRERLACVFSPALPARAQWRDRSISQWTDGLWRGGRKYKHSLFLWGISECQGQRSVNGWEEPFGKMFVDALRIMQRRGKYVCENWGKELKAIRDVIDSLPLRPHVLSDRRYSWLTGGACLHRREHSFSSFWVPPWCSLLYSSISIPFYPPFI